MFKEGSFRSRKIRLRLILATVIIMGGVPSVAKADEVTNWNEIATVNGFASGKAGPAQARIYAMAQAAVHDALNSIDRRYQPYAFDSHADPNASPEAAVATSAHDVLVHELPTRQAVLDAAYSDSLAGIPDGTAKTSGIAIGQAAASALIALRSTDGSSAPMPYTPGTGPGVWQPTPPAFLDAVLPGWGNVTPFIIVSGSQFRPDPPPYFDLTGKKYADDYNEVKAIGEVNSATRTVEQSEIARFWYEGSQNGWSRIARNLSAAKGLDLWASARLLALVNIAIADGYIAGWDSKFTYNFWRPVTAIRAGDTDGNVDTIADPGWSSYLVNPAIPDYVSTHSVLGAAAAEVLAQFFDNDDVSFTTTSGLPFPGITRSFNGFSQAAQENANSRIYAGIHFRSACEDGLKMGRKVGRFAFLHTLKPAL